MVNTSNVFCPIEIKFPSGDELCAASLYRPVGRGPFPIIVMAHGLGGVRNMRLPAFAERFMAEGYACLVFDYRHFGDSGGLPRQLLSVRKQLQDWQSALEYVRSMSNIDTNKIVLWGTSFGGGHVLSTAAKDQNIAAVISQCPFTNGLASSMTLDLVTSLKLTSLAIVDTVGSLFRAKPLMVTVAAREGEVGLMNSHDAYRGYLALQPEGKRSPNFVAARFAMEIIRYYPGRDAKDIKAPVLFCVCDTDTVAPAGPTIKYASQSPKAEVKRYADGHFDIYVGEAFERVVTDQISFLQRHVPPK